MDSFFKSYQKKTEACEIEEFQINKNEIKENLSKYFNFFNDGNGLIDSIRTILNRFISHQNSKEQLAILSLFLSVQIGRAT